MAELFRGDPDFPREEPAPDWEAIQQLLTRIAGSLDQVVDAASSAEQQRNELHRDLGMTVCNGSVPSLEMVRLLRSVRILLVVACLLLLGLLIAR
jgi:hypothetical protein